MYNDASKNTPFHTHVSLYLIWRVHPLFVLNMKSPPPDCVDYWAWDDYHNQKPLNVFVVQFIKINNLEIYAHLYQYASNKLMLDPSVHQNM